jgi:putative transposase
MEDLNTSGMLKNHKLAKAISDVGFHEVKHQLTYKKLLYGGTLTLADRFYPSSKQCSVCGHLKADLTLADRIYQCENCGLEICRDLNAAINLKPTTLGSRESNACGQNDRCAVAIATV